MSSVTVFGAFGRTGRRIVERLAARGDDVTAVGRRTAAPGGPANVRAAVADLTRASPSELSALLEGRDAVVFAAAGDPLTVDRDGAIRVIDAAERASVGHIVLITGMGVGRPRPPEYDGGYWDVYFGAKEASELFLRSRRLRWTILQPGELLSTRGTNRVRLAPTGTLPIGAVTRDDLADVAVTVLRHPQSAGHTWELVQGDLTVSDAIDEAARR